MKIRLRNLLASIFMLALFVPTAQATTNTPPPPPAFSQQELDEMLAPIALYPDSLLSQILMAATYPLEVVEAARWSGANPGLQGEQAVRAIDNRSWDPSVKSLVAFPRVLSMMDQKLDWTESLGDAFLAQSEQVMDTVQGLRSRAYAAGNLRSNEYYNVQQQGQTIIIAPPRPEVVYVPYYDPIVVYGRPWWPVFRPVFWAPWAGVRVHAGFGWSVGITVGHGFFFGGCDWGHRYITAVNARPFYYHGPHGRPMPVYRTWAHSPEHRHGVPYRQPYVQHKYMVNDGARVPMRRGDDTWRHAQPVNRITPPGRVEGNNGRGDHSGNTPWGNPPRNTGLRGSMPDPQNVNSGRRFSNPEKSLRPVEVSDGSRNTNNAPRKIWPGQNREGARVPSERVFRGTPSAPGRPSNSWPVTRSHDNSARIARHANPSPEVRKVDMPKSWGGASGKGLKLPNFDSSKGNRNNKQNFRSDT